MEPELILFFPNSLRTFLELNFLQMIRKLKSRWCCSHNLQNRGTTYSWEVNESQQYENVRLKERNGGGKKMRTMTDERERNSISRMKSFAWRRKKKRRKKCRRKRRRRTRKKEAGGRGKGGEGGKKDIWRGRRRRRGRGERVRKEKKERRGGRKLKPEAVTKKVWNTFWKISFPTSWSAFMVPCPLFLEI